MLSKVSGGSSVLKKPPEDDETSSKEEDWFSFADDSDISKKGD